MLHRDKREWFLFIALLIALFLVFALWSSKERIEIPVRDPEDVQEDPPGSHAHSREGRPPVVVDYETGSSFDDPARDHQNGRVFESWQDPIWPINNFVRQQTPTIIDITDMEDDPAVGVASAPQKPGKDIFSDLKGIGRREEICRRIFEDIYKQPFPKVRPDFLKNPHPRSTRDGKKARNLELDGYNAELEIAFECNGKYHYEPGIFTKSLEEHKYQIWKDEYKRQVCKDRGITLITIPYKVKERDIRACIEEQLPHYREVIERLRARGWQVPERPLQTPTSEGLVEPSIHMGDTASLVDDEHSPGVTYSSSYLDGLDE